MTLFSLSEDTKGKTLTIFFDNGDCEPIPESHVNFKKILKLWLNEDDAPVKDEEIRDLTKIMEAVAKKLAVLSERITVDSAGVYFDGDPLHGELSEIIKKSYLDGEELQVGHLVNFIEKAKTNPSLKSLDDLYRWIKNGDLVIDPDGDILAYKGTNLVNGVPTSVHSGTAFVNGEKITGYIPNVAGTTVTMPRSNVTDNEAIACSTGLHAGTYSYASSFARHLIQVKINPRDVVSVPKDSRDQKMRVSRYIVLDKITDRVKTTFAAAPVAVEEVSETKSTLKAAPVAAERIGAVRDEKGRFIKGAKVARDEKGRFIK
jgi:hypothetical protein